MSKTKQNNKQSFTDFYFEVTKEYKEKYSSTNKLIVLMQCGKFMEVYGIKQSSVDEDEQDNDNGGFNSDVSLLYDYHRITGDAIKSKSKEGKGTYLYKGKYHQVYFTGSPLIKLDFKIQCLLNNGYHVVTFVEQESQGTLEGFENADENGKKRIFDQLYSPGVHFYNDLQHTNNTCCVWIYRNKPTFKSAFYNILFVGATFIDILTGKTHIMEYNIPYRLCPTTFDKLEHYISFFNPTETNIIYNITENDISKVVQYIGLNENGRNENGRQLHLFNMNNLKDNKIIENCQRESYQEVMLESLYANMNMKSYFCDYEYALQSFCYLVSFLSQHNPMFIKRLCKPELLDASTYLKLENHSLKQLHIIKNKDSNTDICISSMLNQCITIIGKREFEKSFMHPSCDPIALQTEYNITNDLLDNSVYPIVSKLLRKIKDITKLFRAVVYNDSKLKPVDIYHIYNSVKDAYDIYKCDMSAKVYDYISYKLPFYDNLHSIFNSLLSFIDEHVYIERCNYDNNNNNNNSDDSDVEEDDDYADTQCIFMLETYPELDEAYKRYKSQLDKLHKYRDLFDKVIEECGNTKGKGKGNTKASNKTNFVKIHITGNHMHSLLATNIRCHILETNIKQYDTSIHGLQFKKHNKSVKYISNVKIEELCEDISLAKQEYDKMLCQTFNSFIKSLVTYNDYIDNIAQYIAVIDIMFMRVEMAKKHGYTMPIIEDNNNQNSYIVCQNLRHALIEQIQKDEIYVGNDISLGVEDTAGILLYGINAVGKTSFIRSIGIAVIMAQVGLFVPATSFQFYPYKRIFTRILNNDNIFKGLSTFAVEMTEMRNIILSCDKNSLILGDELCSGTEIASATAIVVSGLQHMHAHNSSFIFSTHLHDMAQYTEIKELNRLKIKHMSVVYDNESQCLIYDRVMRDGSGGNMYGLEVCKSLHLPQTFLDNALAIREKYFPMDDEINIMKAKTSRYNSNHIISVCDFCNEKAQEVHHLQPQKNADNMGIIKNNKGKTVFNKNHPANLSNICEKCHQKLHKDNIELKKMKTITGKYIYKSIK